MTILIFSFIACEDNLNKTQTVTQTAPACEDPGETGGIQPSPLQFEGIDSVNKVEMTSARIIWNHVEGFYQYHIIQKGQFEDKILKTVKAPKKQVTLNGLTPDTTYEIIVRAIDKSGKIDNNSKKLSFTTLPWPNFNNMKSLSLNGNQFADIGASSNFNTKGAKTISLWFNAQSFEKSVFIDRLFTFFHDNIASSGLSVGVEKDKLTLVYTNKRKVLHTQSVTTTLNIKVWNHLVTTYNNSFIFLYLNGTQVLKVKDTLDHFGSHPAKIGSFTYRHGFHGYIDEFAFYDSSMNSNEVKKIYNSGLTQDLQLTVKKKRLKTWLRMGDDQSDSSTHIQDLIGDNHASPSTGSDFTFAQEAP